MMNSNCDTQMSCFLKSYFMLFDASLIYSDEKNDTVSGVIEWNTDGEKQEFLWSSVDRSINYNDVIVLCNYLVSGKFMAGDRICLSVVEVVERMVNSGWAIDKAINTLRNLCSLKIGMVDNLEITDYFFVHF